MALERFSLHVEERISEDHPQVVAGLAQDAQVHSRPARRIISGTFGE